MPKQIIQEQKAQNHEKISYEKVRSTGRRIKYKIRSSSNNEEIREEKKNKIFQFGILNFRIKIEEKVEKEKKK